jgi:hypothetical protein
MIMLLVTVTGGGCRICADCEDLEYPAYGGAWQRTLRNSGRVGSVFDPGGAKSAQLVDKTTPEDPDQIERNRQEAKDSDDLESDPERSQEGDDEAERESLRDREKELREKGLDDIESDAEEELRSKELDDIEVRIIPGRAPVLIDSQ